jgi:hypothetical protein
MIGRASGSVLAAALLIVLLAGFAWAQTSGGIIVNSTPPGAVIELNGDHTIRGVTPLTLDRGLLGAYNVRAFKAGYEDWAGYVFLSGARRDSIVIRMTAKTPIRAGVRSAILPGWGQLYSKENGKAVAIIIAEAATLTGMFISDSKRTDAQNAVDEAWVAYQQADQIDEIHDTYAELERRYDTLFKWHDYRKRWAYAAIAVWAASILDATLLFPVASDGSHAALPGTDESGFFASIDGQGASAGFAVRF